MDLQLALELLAALLGGFLMGAAVLRYRMAPEAPAVPTDTLTLFDHDGKSATVALPDVEHFLRKGFVRAFPVPSEVG